MQLLTLLSTTIALFGTALAAPAKGGTAPAAPAGNKPTGGPASAQVSVYSGSYICTDPDIPPPTDGSAGKATVVSVTENQCVTINIPFGGAVTASMTATPKTGAAGCYIQMFTQQGCGLTLANQYHGFPFNGLTVGSSVGCASPPVQTYGTLQIVCG
ncbi:hypothetical protein EKO04_009762 [Ascochyta lentis]|uniref:Uncharacterized protein n=1 Tax=Ascochyta lentis TaxID=205686 RepID=A0A8H7MGI4_9PLEO|nr:hypothetical protein EKO04_009762 [Ascochyta lentis]